MSLINTLISNPSIQKNLIASFRKMLAPKGITKVIIDLSKEELELTEVGEGQIIVSEKEHEFYKQFYTENKNQFLNGK